MALYKLNRNHTHRSTLGIVSFIKDEPTWVVPALEKEVIAIGAERVDGDTPDVLEPEKKESLPLSLQERAEAVFAAFQLIAERNEAKDFTGAGVPTVKAVEKLVEFDVDRSEVVELWNEFKVVKDEG
jgi:hypothetical protein